MRKFFRVKGRVVFAGGEPAAGAWLALVDEDPACDDLLGVGVARSDGEFRLTFTSEAFNQEVGENEERPDLYVVASIVTDDGPIPILRQDFEGRTFEGEEDLGVIVLPLKQGEKSVWANKALRSTPGGTKMVRRIHLDDEIVMHAANEVLPLVEELTGWTNLLDGIKLTIVDDFLEVEARELVAELGRHLSPEEQLLAARRAQWCDVTTMALWDNRERTIYINRPIVEAQNYDALKVVLGHELTHVGQTIHHREVDDRISRFRNELYAHMLAGTHHSREELNEHTRFMANIEGHALHVEEALLRVFTHGATIMGANLSARVRSLKRQQATRMSAADEKDLAEMTWREVLESTSRDKSSQYEAGRLAYRQLTTEHGTARFDPALRPEMQFASEMIAAMTKLASSGDPGSQAALGGLYLQGKNGVPRDEAKAKVWLRRAADSGDAKARMLLAATLPKDDPERLALARSSAEQGFAPGQLLYALELLGRADIACAAWFEKAADQGDLDAMDMLVDLYDKGVVVPRDIVKGRVWKKRLEKARAKS